MKHILLKIKAILSQEEKRKYGFLILSNTFIVIIDLASLAVLLLFVNYSTSHGANPSANLPKELHQIDPLLLIVIFLIFFTLKNLLGIYIYQSQQRFIYQVASRISHTKLSKYFTGTYTNYIQVDSAVHIEEISHQPIQFARHILGGMLQLFTEIIVISLTITIMLWFNVKLFLVLSLILSIPTILISYLLKQKLKPVRSQLKVSDEKKLQYLKEALSGFEESNIYSKNEYFTRRYSAFQQKMNSNLADLQTVQIIPNRLMEVFAVMALLVLIMVNRLTAFSHTSAVLNIGAFMAGAYKIIPGVVKLLNINSQMKTYEFTLDSILRNDTQHKERPIFGNSKPIQSITFINSCFQYDTNQKVIERLNFHLEMGILIGVEGTSGKGKTTLINLIVGFLELDSGEILINQRIVSAIDRQGYWKNIAYVKQQAFIIHDSILGNILLESDKSHHDPARLDQALFISGLDIIVNNFPEGINTLIAENGKNISGGQRQRISIARALYKDADIIILDEPFNELDEASEEIMLSQLKLLAKTGKLIILITHNKKSLSACDKIILLDEKV